MLRSPSITPQVMLGIALAVIPSIRAAAATPATMTIDSASQTTATGSKANKNKPNKGAAPENPIELLSVARPGSDATSSAAAGGIRKTTTTGSPSSLIVTKAYDATSAQLEQAEATNEFLRQVTIAFAPSALSGGSVAGSSVKGSKNNKNNQANQSTQANSSSKTAQVLVLKNAQITSIQQTRNIQQITIEYQSIEVTYTSGKTAVSDDWETQ